MRDARPRPRSIASPRNSPVAGFHALSELPDEITTPGPGQIRALLESKLDQLPAGFRTVFVLRSVEELSVEETAECLGIPAETVRSRHFRAKGLLREALARGIDLAERDLFDFGGEHCDRVVANVLQRLQPAVLS